MLAVRSRPFGVTASRCSRVAIIGVTTNGGIRAAVWRPELRYSSTLVADVGAAEKNKQWDVKTATTPKTEISKYPLSVLPNTLLLRSLLVSTISSNRFLLLPALSILNFLSKPNRGFLLNVEKNPIIHGILKKTFYDQFCAGETGVQTKQCVKQLKDLGFRGVILTYAKETVFDHKTNTAHAQGFVAASSTAEHDSAIEEWRVGTLKTVDLIGEGDILAVKVSGAGPAVTAAFTAGDLPPQQMLDAMDEISTVCKQRNIQIIVDAESQHFQKGINRMTLELMRKFNRDGHAVIYNTYQAYLKSTPSNIANHLAEASKDGFTLGLKLVRGAYILSDDRSLIHDTKEDTDNAYNSIAQGAVKRQIGDFGGEAPGARPFPSVNLFLASHNRQSVLEAHRLHQQRVAAKLPTVPVGYGQLHGMSDEVSFSLLAEKGEGQAGPDVYKCSTWGSMSECLAYLLRRAVENRDAVLRTTDEHTALKREFGRRLKSAFSG